MDAAGLLVYLTTTITTIAGVAESVLGEALKTAVKEKILDLSHRLSDKTETARRRAFQAAFDQAAAKMQAQGMLQELLTYSKFQQEVVASLLDTDRLFDFDAQAEEWSKKYPELRQDLKLFFLRLKSHLVLDDTWGPILERYHEIRQDADVGQALKQTRSVDEASVVREIEKFRIEQSIGTVATGGNAIAAQFIKYYFDKVILPVDPQSLVDAARGSSLAEARKAYLVQLHKRCQWLPLKYLGRDPSLDSELRLDDVYITLNTDGRVPLTEEEKKGRPAYAAPELPGRVEERPVTVLEAAAGHTRMALVGDPGSGKSSFAKHLLAWLAAVELGWQAELPPGFEPGLLPVFLTLRDLTGRLDALDLAPQGEDKKNRMLVRALRDQMNEDLNGLHVPGFSEGLLQALRSGKCLLVLDGLDEVPQDLRGVVRQAVQALLVDFSLQRVIVTCRVASYVDEAEQPGFTRVTLEAFTPEQIRKFARLWYQAQAEQEKNWEKRAGDLGSAALQPDLTEISRNPMTMTSLAIAHQEGYELPPQRVRAYRLVVDVLLRRWQRRISGERLVDDPALEALLKDDRRLHKILERLAFEAHQASTQKAQADGEMRRPADLPRWRAQEILLEELKDEDLAKRFLDYIDQRAGILVGRGGRPSQSTPYGFPHRVFQEFLAGRYLLGQPDADRQAAQRAAGGSDWGVAFALGAEDLYYSHGRIGSLKLYEVVYGLLDCQRFNTPALRRRVLWAGKAAALLTASALEADQEKSGAQKLHRLRRELQNVLTHDAKHRGLPAVERAEAGRALAALGDPRDGALHCDRMPFCYVPAGDLQMGSEVFDNEKPVHTVDVPPFWIARWPVTQAQYGEFVRDGGYADERNWEIAIRHKRWEKRRIRRNIDTVEGLKEELADRPYSFGGAFDLENHPVVGVCWYEALAFTRWLERRWKEAGLLPSSGKVRLPSEAQWEKAARGGLRIPLKPIPGSAGAGWQVDETTLSWQKNDAGRVFPWGNTFESDRANTSESGIRSTSAVGAFPGGRSPYGVEELSGNVLEWCSSLWKDYPYRADDGRDELDDEAPVWCAAARGASMCGSPAAPTATGSIL